MLAARGVRDLIFVVKRSDVERLRGAGASSTPGINCGETKARALNIACVEAVYGNAERSGELRSLPWYALLSLAIGFLYSRAV